MPNVIICKNSMAVMTLAASVMLTSLSLMCKHTSPVAYDSDSHADSTA